MVDGILDQADVTFFAALFNLTRLQQAVQNVQARLADQLGTGQFGGGVRAFVLQRRFINDIQDGRQAVFFHPHLEQFQPFAGFVLSRIVLEQARSDKAKVLRSLLFDALPDGDSLQPGASRRLHVTEHDGGTHAFGVGCQGFHQMFSCLLYANCSGGFNGQFAVELRDFLVKANA